MLLSAIIHAQLSEGDAFKKKPFTRFLVVEKVDTVCISFGEKINTGMVIDNLVSWEVRNKENNEIIETGSGISLLEIVFNSPGNYLIYLNHNSESNTNSCEHKTIPDLIELMVSPVKMLFDFEQISFSSPILSGINTDGITLTVNVNVELSGISNYNFNIPAVFTSGTDTNIIAMPVNSEVNLTQGLNQLQYVLNGKVDRPSYVIFDFIDVNSKIQDFTYTLLIN